MNRAWIAAVIFVVGCSSVSQTNNDKRRAELFLQIGTSYLSQGQYPQAMGELLKAEELDPKNPAILNNLGLAFYVRGRLKQAEDRFRSAVRFEPKYSDAKNNLARTLIDEHEYKEALKILQEVEGDLTYEFAEKTFSNMGMAYFEMGEYKKAEDYLARSLEVRRQSCTTANYYGRALLELKQFGESAEMLDKAIEYCRSTHFEDPLYFSALSYFSLGEREKSRARLQELLKEYPKSKYVAKAKGMLELLEQ